MDPKYLNRGTSDLTPRSLAIIAKFKKEALAKIEEEKRKMDDAKRKRPR